MCIFIIGIIHVLYLFRKGPRTLMTVSTADIPVLHSAEVVHFHCESWSPEVTSLLTHYQGRSARFTMKPFKGSSNKLGPLGFPINKQELPSKEWLTKDHEAKMHLTWQVKVIQVRAIRFTRQTDVEPPFLLAQWRAAYTQGDKGCSILDLASHSYANKGNH